MNADQRRESREHHEGGNLTIDLDREEDGRWIAEALETARRYVLRPDPRRGDQ